MAEKKKMAARKEVTRRAVVEIPKEVEIVIRAKRITPTSMKVNKDQRGTVLNLLN